MQISLHSVACTVGHLCKAGCSAKWSNLPGMCLVWIHGVRWKFVPRSRVNRYTHTCISTCTYARTHTHAHTHAHTHTHTHTSQFFGGGRKAPGKRKVKAAAEPIPMDPELEEKISEIEKMAETQVNERLQAMLVSE